MAFALYEYNPATHRGWNSIFIHMTSRWDEQAAIELYPNHGLYMEFGDIQEALLAVNNINRRAYLLEYEWRQALRKARIAPFGLKVAVHPRHPVQVVYLVHGNNIYFAGIEAIRGRTISWAKECVEAISLAEGIDSWQYTFYDIHTMTGDYAPNSLLVQQLSLDPNRKHISVQSWQPIDISPFHKIIHIKDDLPGLPPEVIEVFYDFMYFQSEKITYKQEFYGTRLPLEEVLDLMDQRGGSAQEAGENAGKPAADILYNRILVAATENSGYITDIEEWSIYTGVSEAFPVIAYNHFSTSQRNVFLRMYRDDRVDTSEYRSKGEIVLSEIQANALSRIAARIGLSYDPSQRIISLAFLEGDSEEDME